MSPETMPDQVEVTQGDERAAHAFLDLTYSNQDDLALAFARHRQAAVQKARAETEGLVEEFRALCCSTPTIEQMGQWLSTRVDRLWAALRSSEPSEGWQPIETFSEPTALSSGNGVLIADTMGQVGEAYFRNFGDDDDGWWWVNTSWGDYPAPDRPAPTHWRPLPAPPSLSLPDR